MLLILGALLATAPERNLIDRVVAVVDDDVITLSELDAAAKSLVSADPLRTDSIRKDVLDQLIADRLLEAQLREARIDVSEDEVERAIEDIARQNQISRSDLEEAVKSRGMSISQYKHDLEKQLQRLKLIDLKVRSKVVIADSDIKAEFERRTVTEREQIVDLHHLFFVIPEGADAEAIARVRTRAASARARVANGENFEAVAKEMSEGPTASTGGALNDMPKSGLLPELLRAVQKLRPGQVSETLETSNGIHVVRLDAVRTKDAPMYEEQRGQIYQALYQREVERQMRAWVDELRAAAAVKIRL